MHQNMKALVYGDEHSDYLGVVATNHVAMICQKYIGLSEPEKVIHVNKTEAAKLISILEKFIKGEEINGVQQGEQPATKD